MINYNLQEKSGIIALNMQSWVAKCALIDLICALGKFSLTLERFIQIDIDDVFVGVSGTRMTADDVQALVDFQNDWRNNGVPGLQFMVGFSGKFYQSSTYEPEIEGDKAWLANSQVLNCLLYTSPSPRD